MITEKDKKFLERRKFYSDYTYNTTYLKVENGIKTTIHYKENEGWTGSIKINDVCECSATNNNLAKLLDKLYFTAFKMSIKRMWYFITEFAKI